MRSRLERLRSEVIIEAERPTLWPDLSELTEAEERCDGARIFPPEIEVSIAKKYDCQLRRPQDESEGVA